MSAPLSPFYNHAGARHLLPVDEDVCAEESITNEHWKSLDEIRHVLGGTIKKVKLRENSSNEIFEVELDTSIVFFAKKRKSWNDAQTEVWSRERAANEVALLQWLNAHSEIPVPRVIYSSPSIFVQSKVPGEVLFNCYGALTTQNKESLVKSYATVMTDLFRLSLPQKIGSATAGPTSDSLGVAPRISLRAELGANCVFDCIDELFEHLFTVKRASTRKSCPDAGSHSEHLLDRLYTFTKSQLSQIPPRVLRCALTHDDLSEFNILIDRNSGAVTGIIDWEFNSIVPGVLAAKYPIWLKYDGMEDPRFAPENYWWLETAEESRRLNTIFEETVKARSQEFYDALIQGRTLRAIVDWLSLQGSNDSGCQRMMEWMKDVGAL